jgi:hypothetical protein
MKKHLILALAFTLLTAFAYGAFYPGKLHIPGYPTHDGMFLPYEIPRGFDIADTMYYFGDMGSVRIQPVLDPNDSLLVLDVKVGGSDLDYPAYTSFNRYFQNSVRADFHRLLRQELDRHQQQAAQNEGGGIIPEYVFKMPPGAPKWIAPSNNVAARISIDGSQKLTLSGSSTTHKNAAQTEGSSNKSFNLKMLQELRLRLRGTIGEKIHVTLNHTSISEEQVSNPNVLEISYEGEEDEIMQSIEGGNIALALSGSQYIGYSVSSEGLFGVKAVSKLGPLSLTTIIGKEEGKKNREKYTGSSQADSVTVPSRNYVLRTHYYLANPNKLFSIYPKAQASAEGHPASWGENAIVTDDDGKWIIQQPALLPKDKTQVRVFLDDGDYSNDQIATVVGHDFEDSSDHTDYHFEELLQDSDYSIDYDVGLLVMNRPINTNYTIGVIYINRGGEQVGTSSGGTITPLFMRKSNQTTQDRTWKYQARNFYDLNMSSVQNENFKFNVYTLKEDNTFDYNIPAHLVNDWSGTFNDYLRLDTSGDGVINGDDATVNLSNGYVVFPFLQPFKSLGDSLIYEEERESIGSDEFSIYMYAVGKIGREQISLNSTNILKGSVSVTVNNTTLAENVDYTVDYQSGTITMLTAAGKDPTADIVIDYEYVPMFALESRTLFGFRADLTLSDYAKLGSTFIYQSEKVADKHPKVGNENMVQMMADLDGEITFHPPIMTRIADLLPLIRTDEESEFKLSGEVAVNLPRIYGNPDKKDDPEAYLDDMESIIDTYPLGITRGTWVPGGKPLDVYYPEARLNWSNPDNVYMKDVYNDEDLSEDDKDEKTTILRCRILPLSISMPGDSVKMRAGLMKYIGNQVDFSDKKYLDIMIKADSADCSVNMHVDLGDVSEDFYSRFGNTGVLNTEDGKNGGQKDGLFDYMEDVGLDGIKDGTPGDDPEDNFDNEKKNGNYPKINGTENNNQLDTEDLNGNGALDTTDRYFEYSFTIGQAKYCEGITEDGYLRYRIPINLIDEQRIYTDSSKDPNLEKVSYVRVWFDTVKPANINIVQLDVIGNKWREANIRTILGDQLISPTILNAAHESIQVGTVDNQSGDHYQPPQGTYETTDNVQSLEQSMSFDCLNLQPGHYGVARQKFNDSYNLLTYRKIRFYLYPESPQEEDYPNEIEVLFRLGADSLNYYEVGITTTCYKWNENGNSVMGKALWRDIEISFEDLTQLKELSSITTATTEYDKTVGNVKYHFRKVSNPTLTNIKEMSLGVRVPQGSQEFNGRIYFDDIRVADPDNSPGFAARSSLSAKFADVNDFTANMTYRTPNFYAINTGNRSSNNATPQSFEHNITLTTTDKVYLHKFFPIEWGLSLPLSGSQTQTIKKPMYKANSDVLVTSLDKEEQDRQVTHILNRSANSSISLTRSLGSPWLDYSIKNLSLAADYAINTTVSPSSADTTVAYSERGTYNLDLPKDKMAIGLWRNYQFYWFPDRFTNSLTFRNSFPKRWRWDETSQKYLPETQVIDERWIDQDHSVSYDIFSDLKADFRLAMKRNLMWEGRVRNINFGKEKSYNQNAGLDYSPHYVDNIFTVTSSLDMVYNDERKETKKTDSLTGEQYSEFTLSGSTKRSIGVTMTIKNRDMLMGLADRLGVEPAARRSDRGNDDPGQNDRNPGKDGTTGNGGNQPGTVLDGSNRMRPPGGNHTADTGKPDEFKTPPTDPKKNRPEEDYGKPEKPGEEQVNTEPATEDSLRDEKGSVNVLGSVASFLTKLDNIDTQYSNDYGSTFDERGDRPPFLYRLGMPHTLPSDTLSIRNNDNSFSASTNLAILSNLTTRWSYSLEIDHRWSNTSTLARNTTFPNVQATLSGVDRYIAALFRMDKDNNPVMSGSSLTSSLQVTKRLNCRDSWKDREKYSVGYVMRPLLGWSTNWAFNLDTDFAYNTDTSKETTYREESGNLLRTNQTSGVSADVTHRLDAARGIHIPWIGTIRLKNEFTTDLSFDYEKSRIENKNEATGIVQVEKDQREYSAELGGTYNFHRNVTGGSRVNWSRTRNLKRDEVTTTFGLSFWVEIQF